MRVNVCNDSQRHGRKTEGEITDTTKVTFLFKQSDGEVPVILGPWGIRNTPSLPLLPGPLWPGVVAPDRALSMG